MASEMDKVIWIVADAKTESAEEVTGERWGKDTGGGFGTRGPSREELGAKRFPVSFERLKENTSSFLEMVGELFAQAERQQAAGMKLDEVELAVEINGEGQLSILGSGGKVGGRGAITLKFKRESVNKVTADGKKLGDRDRD